MPSLEAWKEQMERTSCVPTSPRCPDRYRRKTLLPALCPRPRNSRHGTNPVFPSNPIRAWAVRGNASALDVRPDDESHRQSSAESVSGFLHRRGRLLGSLALSLLGVLEGDAVLERKVCDGDPGAPANRGDQPWPIETDRRLAEEILSFDHAVITSRGLLRARVRRRGGSERKPSRIRIAGFVLCLPSTLAWQRSVFTPRVRRTPMPRNASPQPDAVPRCPESLPADLVAQLETLAGSMGDKSNPPPGRTRGLGALGSIGAGLGSRDGTCPC